ncbi:MAG: hypothetical protein A2W61_01720 [Deltaproteobacteria bacterium RIFCSPLOWO2_01_44_7]|nr:MAG: hypothetical protein A2712_10815 [Deltaproteobacteria bacterium RIFCSPHIGHO2_01_FULL_43_49]OGQ44234.1 MAG: hypothetical protein A2W61_01720 [Deltaproteobacteria bacterium RIFCSPLOWO2_01_44_7]
MPLKDVWRYGLLAWQAFEEDPLFQGHHPRKGLQEHPTNSGGGQALFLGSNWREITPVGLSDQNPLIPSPPNKIKNNNKINKLYISIISASFKAFGTVSAN